MKFRSGRQVTASVTDSSNSSDEVEKDKENEENHGPGNPVSATSKRVTSGKGAQSKREPLSKKSDNRDRDQDVKPVISRDRGTNQKAKDKDSFSSKKRERSSAAAENQSESGSPLEKKVKIKKEPKTEKHDDGGSIQESAQNSEPTEEKKAGACSGGGFCTEEDQDMDLFTAEEVTEALLHNATNNPETTVNNMMTQRLFDENEESANENDKHDNDESTEVEDSDRENSVNSHRPKRKLKSKRGKKRKPSCIDKETVELPEYKRITRNKPSTPRRKKKQKTSYEPQSLNQSLSDDAYTTEESTPPPTADEEDNATSNHNESEHIEKRKRGRPCKHSEDKKSKKFKGTAASDSEQGAGRSNFDSQVDANKPCVIVEPCVKVSKIALTDLKGKRNLGVGISEETEKGDSAINPDSSLDNSTSSSTDRDTLEGTLVVWEGPPGEPVFKKNAPKPGRFYIVNCGEPKSLNPCKKPTEVPPPVSSCTCCASGCQSFGSNNNVNANVTGNGNGSSSTHGIVTGETSKRVSRRRPKGPKKVQLVTKEEHHKILSTYIEEKKYEPVDPSQQHQQNSSHPGPINPPTENAPRRTRLQKRMQPTAKQSHSNKQNASQKQQKNRGNSNSNPNPNLTQCQSQPPEPTSTTEEEQVVSFTVGNEELVDDVAGYEMVDSNVANADLQKSAEENPEFGVQLNQEDGGSSEQRQKRPYRMRKVPSKEYHGEITCDQTGKPRCTYTDLIEKALVQSAGGLTVSEIYNWISTNYPYFQANDDRWKNSVRHNLSINPYFKKGDKARNGAGHLWVISEDGKGIRPPIRRKSGSDNIMDSICIENGDVIPIRNETDRAISVILSEYAMASMQHQNSNNQEPESSPFTYIQIPNDIDINGENDHSGQVICYEDLPNGSYTIDVQDSNMHSEQMYTLSDFAEGNVIIVNSDESNKENVDGRMLDDMVVSDFSVLSSDGGMITSGRLSAPPLEAGSIFGGPIKRGERILNRSSSLPLNHPQSTQDMIMDNSSMELHDPNDHQELTILNAITSVGDHEAMDTINVVSASQDTQVIEIIGDHLFDAKELGMVYEYDSQGDPLFL